VFTVKEGKPPGDGARICAIFRAVALHPDVVAALRCQNDNRAGVYEGPKVNRLVRVSVSMARSPMGGTRTKNVHFKLLKAL
jgi:hypothetical protein